MAQVSENTTMDTQNRHHGSLIAFEGPDELVSTQLSLLPTSPQVLILPSLQHYMKLDNGRRFNSRSYIKDVHRAALVRHEAALRFLNSSTGNNKRLVFIHGGTAAAVSQCISAISEHQASGDVISAEAIYKNIAGDGAKRLNHEAKYANQEALEKLNSERDVDEALWEDDNEDPITRAMRAADALYKETESLQPIECYIRTRPRSLSLPMLDYVNELGQASPFFVFGSSPSEGTPSVFGEDEAEPSFAGAEENLNTAGSLRRLPGGQRLRISVPHRSANSMAEAIHARNVESRSTMQLVSPTGDPFMSPPTTPDGVVYGEARLVQMQASKSQCLRKVRSLDDMELNETRRRRISVHIPAVKRVSPIDSPEAKSRHLSIVEDPYSPNNLLHLPQAKFVKAQTTTIRKSPTFLKTMPKPARDTYVHQGTDVADFGSETADLEGEFEPVLPLYEDLVVNFTSCSPDSTLASVIQAFKDGLYPVLDNVPESFKTAETDSCPSTPRTAELFDLDDSKGDGLSPVAEVPSAEEASDYDDYAARAHDVRYGSKITLRRSSPPPPNAQQPPMPAQTPALHVDAKFHDLFIPGHPNAIATQNALRLVLEGYFPQQEASEYLPFSASLLPELNRLWRPLFQDLTAQESRPAQHTADLILAIGSQEGVKSEFVSAITGQIEKLGSKSIGMSRTGRLDIRSLMATAIQSYSTQSLASLSDSPPGDSPSFLACLLLPHLETYLATNTATRFLLLSYPAEHLATVLAMQQLLGADIFKVAGILDTSEASSSRAERPSPFSLHSAGTSSSHSLTTIEKSVDASTLPTPPPPSPPAALPQRPSLAHRLSFSRADYVLTSSATEAEIAALLSTIRTVLVDIDAFYIPEEPPLPPPPPSSSSPPTDGARFPAAAPAARALPTLVSKFTTPASPPLSPPYGGGSDIDTATLRGPGALDFPYPPLSPGRDTSPSQSSVKSGRGRLQQQQQPHIAAAAAAAARSRPRHEEVASGEVLDVVDEGDFDDAEERRLMPMYMRQSEIRKGNSRKALKWLGLA